ncbi:MAG: hypothetical protein JOY64_19610 [Alphaproteobacteria bacterium]|nr:hypothetical protein [Alphaproteobacteria bacterium]
MSLFLLSLSACSLAMDRATDQADDLTDAQLEARLARLDARLRAMTGDSERQLLNAMGRAPDTIFPQAGPPGDDQTTVLQWWWDTPSCSPRRIVDARTQMPVRDSFCTVEWTVSKDTSQNYHWEGYGCRSIPLANYTASSPGPVQPR